MKLTIKLILLLSLTALTACGKTTVKRDPAYAPARPIAVSEPKEMNGSIFNVANNVSYFEDYRARRVGDILTVKLEENTSAKKDSETTINKSSSSEIENPTIFGASPQFSLPKLLGLESLVGNNLSFGVSSNNDFSGSGESDLSNKLSGNISVSVIEVLPNGNMVVRGEKVMTINQGNEYIRIAGMISPRDIDGNNSISSTRIADAQISYVGDGPTNDANVMGWLSRFFISALLPF